MSTPRCSRRPSGSARPPPGGEWCCRRSCPTVPARYGLEISVRETAIKLVLQTRGRENNQDILDAARAEGFSVRVERDA
jgi:hypothetical protein